LFYNSVLYIFYVGAESSWSCVRAGFQEVLSLRCIVQPPSGEDRNNHHRLSCASIHPLIHQSFCLHLHFAYMHLLDVPF